MAYELLGHQNKIRRWLGQDIAAAWGIKGIEDAPPPVEEVSGAKFPRCYLYLAEAVPDEEVGSFCSEGVRLTWRITLRYKKPQGGVPQFDKWQKAEDLRVLLMSATHYGRERAEDGSEDLTEKGYLREWGSDQYIEEDSPSDTAWDSVVVEFVTIPEVVVR